MSRREKNGIISMEADLIKHGRDAELKLKGYIDAANAPDIHKIPTGADRSSVALSIPVWTCTPRAASSPRKT